MKTVELISYILMIISIVIILYILFYFKTFSPDFLTHEQYFVSTIGIMGAFFSALIAMWSNLTGKLVDISNKMIDISNNMITFAKDLGEIKGTLRQYISNHPRKGK